MINLNIKATSMELTPAIREYVEEKITALEKMVDDSDTTAHADVEVGQTSKHHQHGDIFRAEINLSIAGEMLRVESQQDNLYAAIDEVKDEMQRQLRKVKTKRESAQRKGGLQFKKMLRRLTGRE